MYIQIFTTLLLFFLTLFLYFYWYLKKTRRYFRDAGIPYLEPHWLFGNMKDGVLMKKSFLMELADLYKKLEPHKFAGIFILHNKTIMVRDPELIKRILVKDFAYFQDHGLTFSKKLEPLGNHLFNMEGEEWKNLRIKLTGTFTSGKMKMMFPLMKKCAEGIKPALMEYVSCDDGLEIRDLCARYTTDAISTCAFGIDTHSLQNPESEFRQMGKRVFEPRWQSFFRAFFRNIPDWCIQLFGLETFSKEVMDYFMKTVKDMVKYREENNISRGDFLDLLIALKNHRDMEKLKDAQEEADLAKFMAQVGDKCVKSNVEMTIELMAAQCFIFFVGGFEGTSASIAFLLFELAQHPDIQDKVREEVVSNIETNGGEVTYDMLKKLNYLNMVLSETIRKYSNNSSVIVRQCKENYKIPDSEAIIEKGMQVFIPMIGLQLDKKYFEKPEEFYPEHFTKQAIANRHHFTYLPFGEGPRVCIAERFARMQILMGVIYLIKEFSFEMSPKTKLPLEFLSSFGVLPVKGGLWLKCHPL